MTDNKVCLTIFKMANKTLNLPNGSQAGVQELSGSQACAEGALAAGCRFLAAYPITPSVEIVERFTSKCKDFDATFIQMEDEISALAAVLGASWTGRKSMTITSGPGFSLMMEHLGLGVMLETPCVIIDIQRCGPSEGIPNGPCQGDIMQARWGSHGDYEVIVLSPNSPQELFDLTIKAFNLSEKYRTPVVLLGDAGVVSLNEKVEIPAVDKIKIDTRKYYKGPKDKYLPFKYDDDLVPPMVNVGEGYKFHVTGLTHDERGYPVMKTECQELNIHRIVNKIRLNTDKIVEIEEKNIEDAEVVVVSYGITSRAAIKAVEQARKEGIKAGSLRPITIWPFPEKRVNELSKKIKAFVVPEINYGQIVLEIERCNKGNANVVFISHNADNVGNSDNILSAIKKALKEGKKEGVIEYK